MVVSFQHVRYAHFRFLVRGFVAVTNVCNFHRDLLTEN